MSTSIIPMYDRNFHSANSLRLPPLTQTSTALAMSHPSLPQPLPPIPHNNDSFAFTLHASRDSTTGTMRRHHSLQDLAGSVKRSPLQLPSINDLFQDLQPPTMPSPGSLPATIPTTTMSHPATPTAFSLPSLASPYTHEPRRIPNGTLMDSSSVSSSSSSLGLAHLTPNPGYARFPSPATSTSTSDSEQKSATGGVSPRLSTNTIAGSTITNPTSDHTNRIKKRRSNLPKNVTSILMVWLSEHINHPYPSEAEKSELLKRTGLTGCQLSNWFINARRRKISGLSSGKLVLKQGKQKKKKEELRTV